MNSFRRTLSTITKPFSHAHKTLVGLGFTSAQEKHPSLYKLTFVSAETARRYTLYVKAATGENGQAEVKLGAARFEEKHVPEQVMEAAESKLLDAAHYLEQPDGKRGETGHTFNSMAPDEEAIVQLGKQMKHMKTGSELLEEGLIPDPIP